VRVVALEQALNDGIPVADALTHLSTIDFTNDQKASAPTRQRLAGVALTRALKGMIP
jgi:hypothetical protein